MCGIVGYVGKRPVQDVLLAGLRRLEYRGYDSAGISVIHGDHIDSVRAVGNLSHLDEALAGRGEGGVAVATRPATTGIGHTRWATHGRVSEANAHPHFDTDDTVHVVVNGIVENYLALKRRLIDGGAVFTSETDAEVIAHLVAHHLDSCDLVEAVRRAYAELEGHFAFVTMALEDPDTLVGARKECPLVVGRGDGEQFVASAVPAFLAHTRDIQVIDNDELVVLRPEGVTVMTPAGEELDRAVTTVDWDEETAEKGGFETFMLKEMHEQGEAAAAAIADTTLDERLLREAQRIVVVACGTSHHAGVGCRSAIEEGARLPVEMDIASEDRCRHPDVGPRDPVIGLTQSGETADTLAAMRIARERGAKVLAVTNVVGSQATRDADGVLFTRAGLEVSVAATKTFVCQVAAMYLLALRLAELRGTLARERIAELVAEIKQLPTRINELVEQLDETIRETAERHAHSDFYLYLGRHVGRAVAL